MNTENAHSKPDATAVNLTVRMNTELDNSVQLVQVFDQVMSYFHQRKGLSSYERRAAIDWLVSRYNHYTHPSPT